jgi:ketosteroid isomerase-like protein
MTEDSNAAARFRAAVDNRDLAAMLATMAPDAGSFAPRMREGSPASH